MTLKSIAEDLQQRTLRAVAGFLGKLAYLAGLREADGRYVHWGLGRVHESRLDHNVAAMFQPSGQEPQKR